MHSNKLFKFQDDLGELINPKKILILKNYKIPSLILKNFFYQMKKIRMVEDEVAKLVRRKIINTPTHLCTGQEAVPVGVSYNLKSSDRVFGNHRSHGHLLALSENLKSFFAELLGKETGLCSGKGGSMHLIDKKNSFHGSVPIVGGTIPIAVGSAFAQRYKKNNSISISYLGDGASEEGVFHESLNLSKIYGLPVLFVVENNLFSSHMDISLRQPSNKVARYAQSHSINSITIDGNDILKIYEVSKKIIRKMRSNPEPFLLEVITFRHLGHVGPNKDIDVGIQRDKKNLKLWTKNKDPIKSLENLLIKNKISNKSDILKICLNIKNKINAAVKFALNSRYPKKSDLFKDVY